MSWRRLRSVFRASPRQEADDEIAFHISEHTRELIAQGTDPSVARRLAEQRFGPIGPIERAMEDSTRRRRAREARTELFMNLIQDLRYGLRVLRRNPAFAAAAITTLALGVGATLAVFNVVNGVLLRPLPYKDTDRVNMIWIEMIGEDGSRSQLPLTSGFFADIERESRSFAALAAFRSWSAAIAESPTAEREPIAGARVSPALFDVLGVRPAAGRAFTRDEAMPGAPSVALISHDLWQRKFGGDRGIVGRQVYLNGSPFTVTGVMPPGFSFPRGAELPSPFQFGVRTDVWMPLVFDSTDMHNYGTMNLSAIGRLRDDGCGRPGGCTAPVAQAELTAIIKRVLAEIAPRLNFEYQLVSMTDQAASRVRRPLLILLGAVALLLVIAAANVTSLLVARVQARLRELAVRAALGAARGRIARQLVIENLVLCVLGTAIGLVIAHWGTRIMLALVPGSLPRADDIGLDWRVLSLAGGLAVATAIGFGVAAAYAVRWGTNGARGSPITNALHTGDTRAAGSVGHRNARRLLVVAEVALSLVLLIGATLLTRSFVLLQQVPPGLEPANVLTAHVNIPIAGRFLPAVDGPRWARTFVEISDRLGSAPGVVAAGAVSSLPMSGAMEFGGVGLVGRTYAPGEVPRTLYHVVAGDYFRAAGIRLAAGRTFDSSDRDSSRATIIVSRKFAREQFGSEANAVGREVRPTFEMIPGRPPRTIVGVVDEVKHGSLDEEPGAQVYVPVTQFPYPGLVFLARTSAEPTSALPILRKTVREVDAGVTIRDVRTMEDVVSESLARQRFNMTLIGTFAAIALVLAVVGLYGVLALVVGQRRREIGVRLALGATPRAVVAMLLSEGARVAGVGVVLGVAGALALTRVLRSLLYGISTTDAVTFAVATMFVGAVAMAATWLPARRAARVDPRTALAAE